MIAAMERGNSVEVELKYIGPDLEAVRRRLREVGAQLGSARALEVNLVFDTEDGGLAATGRLLRLRDGRELTVKTPVDDAEFKSRREFTIQVAEGDTEGLLGALGYRIRWRYEKWREGWALDGMWITLDELPFVGAVVEIEGDRAKIQATARRLGLDGLPTSTGSYRDLFLEYAGKEGGADGDMTFAAATSSS
jgi:adenylate cyclase class 2